MKRIALVLLVACASTARADDVYVPNSIYYGQCNVIPFSGAWPSSSNPRAEWRYQTLLLPAAIGRAGAITEIAFLGCHSGRVLNAQNFRISMSHTMRTTISSIFALNLPNPKIVRPSGPFTFATTAQARPFSFPLFFVENRDRYGPEVRYHVEHVSGAILFEDRAIVFREHGRDDLRLEFPGCRPVAHVCAEAPLATRVHYLIGKEPDWRTDVPAFGVLRYAGLWPGIDLVLRGERGEVKYEFHVAPGADPRVIQMRYVGAELTIDGDGKLEVCGSIVRADPAPVSYQEDGGVRPTIASSFSLDSETADTVGFTIGEYDPAWPLVIDPAFIVYNGYLVQGVVNVTGVAVDATGAACFSGIVNTATGFDACVGRVRPDGTGLDFVTYFGSTQGSDVAMDVSVDASGIYLGGHTSSDENSFPVKRGPDLTHNGGGLDAFICKLMSDGKTVEFCGYVGGAKNDGIRDMAVDQSGAIWLAGQTDSADYPVSGGPQLTQPGPFPACVTKVAPDGRSLVFSGYLGGSSPHTQFCSGVAVDAKGDGYVVGITGSDENSFPVKTGPLTKWQGGIDAFIAKIDGSAGTIRYAGYVGGALDESTWGIAVDQQGAAYITGITQSDHTTFPVRGGPLLVATPSQRGDCFLTKVNPAGTGFDYSGFLGGVSAPGMAVDRQGRAYIGGNTWANPPIPIGGALSSFIAGSLDGALLRIAPDGRSFDYAGFLGGVGQDSINTLALGPTGAVYVAGQTWSRGTFPLKIGPSLAYNNTLGPGTFLTKVAQTVAACPLAARPGTAIPIDCVASEDVGSPFQVGTSLGVGPIIVPGPRVLDLTPDALLQASVLGALPAVFKNYSGVVPVNGEWQATIQLPPWPALVGLNLHTAFLTFASGSPGGIKSVSNRATVTIVP